MAEYFVVDTTLVAHLTKFSRHTLSYHRALGTATVAVSFQTLAELLAADYAPSRRSRLDALMNQALELPHSQAASAYYAHITRARRQLRRARRAGSDASDADVWIIANAIEYGVPLMSHDAQQVALGRFVGLAVFSALPGHQEGNPR